MKVQDILAESNKNHRENIEEAPMGFLSKAGRTIASKLGSKTSAAKLDVGTRANEIFDNFQEWALRAGVDMKLVSVKQLSDWLKRQNLPVPKLGPLTATYDLTNNKTVADIFKGIASSVYAAAPGSTSQNLGGRYGLSPAQQARPQATRAAPAAQQRQARTPAASTATAEMDFETLKRSITSMNLTQDQKDEILALL